jgi:hypothetical protein
MACIFLLATRLIVICIASKFPARNTKKQVEGQEKQICVISAYFRQWNEKRSWRNVVRVYDF